MSDCWAGGAWLTFTYPVLVPGAVVVTTTLAGFPAIAPGTVSGVVVVVVVVTERVGAGGGGEYTVCDSGCEAQPASRPMTPQQVRAGVSCLTTRTGVEPDRNEIIFVFMFPNYIWFRFRTMGCSTVGTTTVGQLLISAAGHIHTRIQFGYAVRRWHICSQIGHVVAFRHVHTLHAIRCQGTVTAALVIQHWIPTKSCWRAVA